MMVQLSIHGFNKLWEPITDELNPNITTNLQTITYG